MSTNTPGSDEWRRLRQQAEQRHRLATQDPGQRASDELQRLVQELQVHQIELEMQNEELLRAQAELHQTRAEYVDLYDFAPVGYCTLHADGVIEQLNLCAARYLGLAREQLLGRRLALFVALAGREEFEQFLTRLAAADTSQTSEVALLRADNAPLYVRLEGLRIAAEGRPVRFRIVLLDITRPRQTTAALAASEARFRQLFERSRDAVALLQNGRYVDCNAAALRLLGATRREQIVGQELTTFVPDYQPDGRRTAELFADSVAQAQRLGSWRCEAQMRRFTGEPIWMEAVITCIREDEAGPLLHVLWRDVTAARAAAAQLHREKEFSESLLENSVDAIVALSPEGIVTAWNAEAARYSGMPAAQVLGRSIFELMPHLETPAGRERLRQVLAGRRIERLGVPFQLRRGRFDVYLVPLHDRAQQVVTGMLAIVRDVTERERLAEEVTQARLRQQQEVLAASLASQETERKRIAEALHNGLGQLLYAIKLNLENKDGERSSLTEAHRLLLEAIRVTRTISFELTPSVLEDFGLRTALEELVKRIPPHHLPVGLDVQGLDARLPVQVEMGVYRVVQELLNNVIRHAGATDAQVHVLRRPQQLAVSVEDNGCGFDPDALAAHPGGGIGLMGVRNRIALLGGTLRVNSQPGGGTIVSFELPLFAAAADGHAAAAE